MNILMITYEIADQGGNYIRCFSLAKNLVKRGHRVTLMASNIKKRLVTVSRFEEGVLVIEFPCILPHRIRHDGTSIFQIISRCLHILTHRYDIIHGFGHRPAVIIPALLHRALYQKPYFADWADLWGRGGISIYRGLIKGAPVRIFDTLTEPWIYSHVDGLTVISSDLKKRALNLGLPPYKIQLLKVGADIDSIRPLSKDTARKKLNLPSGAPIAVFVGQSTYDITFLARIYIELICFNPRATLLLVGPRFLEFERIIAEANKRTHIIYLGQLSHLKIGDVLACGDVMLLPYTDRPINRGRYPNKIGDYLAAGRPIVSNPTGDIKQLFKKYRIGLLAGETPREFASVVNRLFHDKHLSSVLGLNARHLAETKLSWYNLSGILEKFYRKYGKK